MKGCALCGFKNPDALEFHHANGDKKFTIGGQVHNKGWETIKQEVFKCTVLCSNCHNILHAKRFESYSQN